MALEFVLNLVVLSSSQFLEVKFCKYMFLANLLMHLILCVHAILCSCEIMLLIIFLHFRCTGKIERCGHSTCCSVS